MRPQSVAEIGSPVRWLMETHAGSNGVVTHAFGFPGAPPLRETRHHQGLGTASAVPIGRDQAHGQRREWLGSLPCKHTELRERIYAPYGFQPDMARRIPCEHQV
jgi:hypothetical protein